VTEGSLSHTFATAHHELKPRTPAPEIHAEFFPFAGISHTARLNNGRLSVRVSDLLQDAPGEIQHALALILLAKLYRKKIDAAYHRQYRAFILQSDMQERARELRSHRGRGVRVVASRGRYVDLDDVFDRMNREYFEGLLEKPGISWSMKRSRRILGRFDAAHRTIFISRLFDSPRIPLSVTEYVMFHEMLHLKHQTRVEECRQIVHTPEFRQDERRFNGYDDARAWLKSFV
jgi:predicted metal-dependent hydrolase